MKKYPIRCTNCHYDFFITKQEINKESDGATNTYHYVYCPMCKHRFGEWSKDNFLRIYNVGYIENKRPIFIKS